MDMALDNQKTSAIAEELQKILGVEVKPDTEGCWKEGAFGVRFSIGTGKVVPAFFVPESYSIAESIACVKKGYERFMEQGTSYLGALGESLGTPNKESLLGGVVPVLMSRNNPVVKNLVSRPFMGDMVITYKAIVGESKDGGLMTIPFQKKIVEGMGISEAELYDSAIGRVFDAEIETMSSAISSILGGGGDDLSDADKMYVMSNKYRMFGASTILKKENLEKMASVLGGAFYVLPSSIHEVICVPVSDVEPDNTALDLAMMVREVNRESVSPDDLLSDTVYVYKDGQLTVLDEQTELGMFTLPGDMFSLFAC